MKFIVPLLMSLPLAFGLGCSSSPSEPTGSTAQPATSAEGHEHGEPHHSDEAGEHEHHHGGEAAHEAGEPGEGDAQADSEDWTCPMHPEIHEAHEGRCPKCNMFLVRAKAEAAEGSKTGGTEGEAHDNAAHKHSGT